MKIVRIIFYLFLILSANDIYAQIKPFTIHEKLLLEIPAGPVISPAGNKILFTIRKADFDESKWNTQIYLLDAQTDRYLQFTHSKESCTNPAFSPDQKWITFLTPRKFINDEGDSISGVTQLWSAPFDGGEAVNWTSLENGVNEYIWSKDGNFIAIMTDFIDEETKAQMEVNSKKKIDAIVYPQKNPVKELVIFDVESKTVSNRFLLDPGAQNINFSTDGKRIVYQTNYTGEYNDEQMFDIYIIDLDGIKTPVTTFEGPETQPQFSPDDKWLSFISQTVPDIEFAETDLNLIKPDGTTRVNLTEKFGYSVNSYKWKDNSTILFTVNERTDIHLYEINIADNFISKLSDGNAVIADLSLSSDGNYFSYRHQSSTQIAEIFVNGKQVTDFSSQLEMFDPGSQEVISYRSKDDRFDIEAVLYKPADFDPAKKYPLILSIHGGPYNVFLNTYYHVYPVKILTGLGYLVLAPNPRGSSGYSDEFGQANRYDLGGGDYEDLMAGVDFLISKGFVDSSRMGVFGGSYGGYLTNWLISQTNRFKAAVSMYGIFSWFTDWSNSWQPAFEYMYFGYHYWERPIDFNNLYVNRSPAFHVTDIQTPTLILQGERDVYTAVANSREMYQALHTLGVPVEFVIYKRAGHGIRNEPNQYIDLTERLVGWFNRYLKNE